MALVVMDHLAPGRWVPLVDEQGCIIFFDTPAEAMEFANHRLDIVDPYVMALGADIR